MNHLDNLILRYPALSECREQIQTAFEIMREAYRADKKLLVCGNGGSASDSEHIVGELMKEFSIRRPLDQQMKTKLLEAGDEDGMLAQNLQGALPAITLTENCALSTAYANDAVPILNFAQQVYGYGTENDVLLGISTSGAVGASGSGLSALPGLCNQNSESQGNACNWINRKIGRMYERVMRCCNLCSGNGNIPYSGTASAGLPLFMSDD